MQNGPTIFSDKTRSDRDRGDSVSTLIGKDYEFVVAVVALIICYDENVNGAASRLTTNISRS